ncbi:MAG: hypothetical protein CMI76_04840 [Candidatus Pelagibacter sp.]|nr:hypothetical protein [Candidatus Pelagibacter sp.]|tara:strand:- start:691 stop:1314 length:624 start_codon:yes stop_codon:yes gene_type:complete
MGKKYLETKEKSLESSVLGIWQEAAKKADELDEAKFSPKEIKMAIGVASDKRYAGGNMTGAVKAIEKMKKGLSDHPQVKAVLRRQNEAKLDPVNKKALKKDFDDRKDKDIDNDGDVDDSDKYLAKRRKAVSKAIAKEETIQAQIDKAKEFKIQDMKSALAQVWGMEEGKNPFKKEEEEKPVITKGGKTLTGKKPAEIDVKPKINKEA